MGLINYFGPKHSGSFAVALALPTAVVVILLIALSAPHFTTRFLEPRHQSLTTVWVQFVGVILALSGAESIANLTGVMKLDPGSTMEHPTVARESLKAITPVAIEVVIGTALLGWAMLSLPSIVGKTLTSDGQRRDRRGPRTAERGHVALHRRAICHCHIFPRRRAGIRVDRWNCFLLAALERSQHSHCSDDRSALHDVARSRDAATIPTPQWPRRSHLAAVHRQRPAGGRAAFCSKLHRVGRPLCHRRSRGDHGQRRFLHIQSLQGFHLVPIACCLASPS